MHVCMHIHTSLVFSYKQKHMRTHLCTFTTCIYVLCIYIYIYICTHTRTHIYIYIYICIKSVYVFCEYMHGWINGRMEVCIQRYVSHVALPYHGRRPTPLAPSCRLCQRYRADLQRGRPLSSLASSSVHQSRVRRVCKFYRIHYVFRKGRYFSCRCIGLRTSRQMHRRAKRRALSPAGISSCDGKLLL